MRILAIRGENIASLERFEVDFEADPLGRAGLFAITGPTGSGKSSILDALCLALFDQTPRLEGRSTVRPGRRGEADGDRLTVTDVRNLLRRGAVAGKAEVDFTGVDGRRYRATWEVWRARKRVTGNLQPQVVSLVDLQTGQPLGDNKKTDTLAAIQARLGLDFDQFRRSALLAQGDFAAFLRASEGQRADLLEAMTGTDIYGRISHQAYARAKAERVALKGLRDQVEAVQLLGEDDRAAVQAEVAALAVRLQGVVAARDSADAWVAWHRAARHHDEAVQAAKAARAAAQERWVGLAEVRAELAAALEAAPLRGAVEAADGRAAEARQAAATVARLQQERDVAVAQQRAAAEAVAAAQARVEAARQIASEWAPRLEQAALLDDRAERLREAVTAAAGEAAAAAARAQEAQSALAALDARQERLQAQEAAAIAWLEAHPAVAAVEADWKGVAERLEGLAEALPALPRQEAAVEAAAQALEAARVAEQAAQAALGQAQGAATAAATRATAAADLAAAHPRDPVDAALEAAKARGVALSQLEGVLEERAEVQAALQRDRDRLSRVSDELQRAEADLREANSQREQAERLLADARRLQRLARARADVGVHRPDLRPGEACPLCGAEEHPWAHVEVEAAADLAAADALVAEHEGAVEAQGRRATAAQQRRGEAAGVRKALAPQVQAAAEKLDRLADKRDALASGLDLALPEGGPLAGVVAAQEANAAEQQRLVQAQRECIQRARAASEARDAADAARAGLEAARGEHATAAEAARAATAQSEAAARALQQVQAAVAQGLARLDAPLAGLAGWRDGLRADPAGFQARLEALVGGWRERIGARDAARADLTGLKEERAGRAAEAKAGEAARARTAGAEAEARAALAEAVQGRDALFEDTDYAGRSTSAAREAIQAAVAEAEAGHQAATAAAGQAQAQAAGVAGQLQAAEAAGVQAQARAAEAQQALDAALAEAGLDLPTVRARLARGPEWIPATREQVEQATKAVEQAQVVLEERQSQAAAHAGAQPDPLVPLPSDAGPPADAGPPSDAPPASRPDAAQASAAQAEARAHHDALTQQRADAQARLTDDDRKRAHTAGLLDRIQRQQEVVDHWRVLEELIGSSDGKRFRTFAQSLTLDALLVEANGHLEALAPRYELQRIPDHDLEIQLIDHYMADEVRGVHSLSGGESFLVSLALALGLSSLSARDTAVETLFIDEGFGTLDPDALGVALSTLEQLQSEGRQVGLISHVPGLAQSMGACISVEPQGNGRSRVRVLGPEATLGA